MKITIYTPTDKPILSIPISEKTHAVIASNAKNAGLTTQEYLQRLFTKTLKAIFTTRTDESK